MDASAELSFLNCYICFQPLRKPKMCPSCSKVACEKCLRTWIEEKRAECPHCRKMTPLSNFAECERFISDVKHLLQAMDKNQKVKEKCPEHQIQMSYYCEQCNVAICSDCGIFGSKHKGHKMTHLKRVYQEYKNKILNELARFDQRIETLRKNGYHIKLEMQKLVIQIGQRKNFIQQYFVAILERLQQQFKQKQQKINERYQSNNHEIQFYEGFRQNICRELQMQPENQLITRSSEMITYIQKVCLKNVEIQQVEYSFDTIHEIVPKYNQFKYTLKNYKNLGDSIVYSQPYINNGIEWRLKTYPRGNGLAKDTHMSVFLQMTKAFSSGNKYQYKIQLVNVKSSKDSVIRQYSSNFDIGECWGYNQFIPVEELNNDFITENGDLLFNVSVRNPSYRSLVRDQKEYIENLQNKINNGNQQQDQVVFKKGSNKVIGYRELMNKQHQQKIKKILVAHSEGDEKVQEQIQQGPPRMNRIYSSRLERSQKKLEMRIDIGESAEEDQQQLNDPMHINMHLSEN